MPKHPVSIPDGDVVGLDTGPREDEVVAAFPEHAGPIELDVFLDEPNQHGEQHVARFHAHTAPLPHEVLILYPSTYDEGDDSRGARVFEVLGRTWHVTQYGDRPPILGCQLHVRLKPYLYSGATPTPPASPEQVHTLLLLVMAREDLVPEIDGIRLWEGYQLEEVATWASAVHLKASDHDDVVVPPVPEILGNPDAPFPPKGE